MFRRDLLAELRKWKLKQPCKPLIIRGARQVGKTTIVRQFSTEFKEFIYLNLELAEDKKPFEDFTNIETLIQAIFFLKNKQLKDRANTLVFIDEIQQVPQALQQMRYFYEETPEIPVIAAGSMLESLFSPEISFPVGRVEYLMLHPVSFTEFLGALGETAAIEQMQKTPLPGFAHEKLLRLFHTYCLVGGMPEIVQQYAASKDLTALTPVYESLLASYLDDVEKYASSNSQIQYIRHVIRSSFAEAGKRIKFQGFGHSVYKSREIGEALRLLEKAWLIHLIYPQTSPVLPFQPDLGKSPRLQMLDTGLLNYFAGLQREILGTTDLSSIYQGRMIEHMVGQEFLALQYSPLYRIAFWVREKPTSVAEIDYLHQYRDKLIPVEVKSGATGSLRSLIQFMELSPQDMAIRFYSGKILVSTLMTPGGKTFRLLNLPYYLVSRVDNYLEWLENSQLSGDDSFS